MEINMSKYVTITARIMTVDEASEKCDELGLGGKLRKFILDEFEEYNDMESDEDGPGNFVGEDGKISYGMSWEGIEEMVAKNMGVEMEETPDGYWAYPPQVRKIFDVFFQE
jgi:hypothetical protein